jgi:carbamoyl-phosphate synthase large subunit
MGPRVLVTSAGSGASNSLVRSLRAGRAGISILGGNDDRFVLAKSDADGRYLLPSPAAPHFAASMRRLVDTDGVDLVIPVTDGDVALLSALRADLGDRVFLPAGPTVAVCQDKYELTEVLRGAGVPAPRTLPVREVGDIAAIFEQFPPGRLWCRIRTGSGSVAALPVVDPGQARSWIEYWASMRGVPVEWFTLSEYLPGRDFACQSLWREGRLVLIKTGERLSYFGGAGRASGVSSTPALARSVVAPEVVDVCARAVRAVDPRASGVFSIDLKENARGVPCVTEINAGRFFMITNLFDLTGKHNMAATYVALALGQPVEMRDEYDVAEDWYLVRDLDTVPGIFHADDLFEGILDAWAPA